jgi:hypothetical protein
MLTPGNPQSTIANPQFSKALSEAGPARSATLKIHDLAIRSHDSLGHGTPVVVFIGAGHRQVTFGPIVHAFPANTVADFVTHILYPFVHV